MENKGNFSWGCLNENEKCHSIYYIFFLPYCELTFGMFVAIWTFHFIYTFFLTNTNRYVIYILYKFMKSKIHSQSNSSILLTFAFNIFYYLLNWKYTQFSVDLGEREGRTIIQVWYKCSNVLLSHFISFLYWYIISKFGLVFQCIR